MKTRLLKEFRQLLPALFAAVALLPMAILLQAGAHLTEVYCFGLVLLAITPFSREFSQSTFASLLVQPISRSCLWWEKTAVTVCSMGFLSFTFVVAWRLASTLFADLHFPGWTFTLGAIAVVLAGGFLWILLFRHVAAAVIFTLLIPSLLGIAEFVAFGKPLSGMWIFELTLAAYSIAAFTLGFKLFLKSQDYDSLRREITITWRRRKVSVLEAHATSGRTPLWALMKKEMSLQQINFVCAAIVYVAWILIVVGIACAFSGLSTFVPRVSLDGMFILACVILAILVGTVSVAEERRLGMLEAQLCLPITRRRQFVVKLLTTLGVSVLLAALLPSLLVQSLAFTGYEFLGFDFPLAHFAVCALAVSMVAFYASSLAQNTLQALLTTIGIILVLGALTIGILAVFGFLIMLGFWLLSLGPLQYVSKLLTAIIGIPIGAIVMLGLSYANFRMPEEGGRWWLRNLRTWVVSILTVFVLAFLVYHRCWEWVVPPGEPAHGPARLSQSAPPKLLSVGNKKCILLPDGRLWMYSDYVTVTGWRLIPNLRIGHLKATSGFVAGTNWLDVALSYNSCVGVRADGSLWYLPFFLPDSRETVMRRIGSDTDWKAVAAGFDHFLALKKNGTLWGWGKNSSSELGTPKSRSRVETPVQIGDDADWTAVRAGGSCSLAVKSDGTVWRWGQWLTESNNEWQMQIIHKPLRWEGFPVGPFVSLQAPNPNGTAVTSDGSIFAWGLIAAFPQHAGNAMPVHEVARLGHESDWADAVISYNLRVAAIKRDGSLWSTRILSFVARRQATGEITFSRLGQHSDWLAVTPWGDSFDALSADGTLWQWEKYFSRAGLGLLAPSRKPQRIANIFEQQ